ncbi:hypothetical protein GCM10009850_028380 [Nonomuraea monospora]|uniref:PE domain-containing protein n=1 Tax=Nonomuraea monospora TaxID=568818 RepID=A0ABN3CDU7_9ACTN
MGTPDADPPVDPLFIDPYTAELIKSDGRVHEPSTMRAVAGELAKSIEAVEKAGGDGSAVADIHVGATPFGQWADAKTFGAAAGDGAGQQLGQVYAEFIKAYKSVVAAVEASASNHAEADMRSEGA